MERKIEDTWAFTEKWSLRRVWLKLLCNPSPSICLAWSPCILGEPILILGLPNYNLKMNYTTSSAIYL